MKIFNVSSVFQQQFNKKHEKKCIYTFSLIYCSMLVIKSCHQSFSNSKDFVSFSIFDIILLYYINSRKYLHLFVVRELN